MFRCKFCGNITDERRTTGVIRDDEIEVVFYCTECGALEPYEEKKQNEI